MKSHRSNVIAVFERCNYWVHSAAAMRCAIRSTLKSVPQIISRPSPLIGCRQHPSALFVWSRVCGAVTRREAPAGAGVTSHKADAGLHYRAGMYSYLNRKSDRRCCRHHGYIAAGPLFRWVDLQPTRVQPPRWFRDRYSPRSDRRSKAVSKTVAGQ